MHRRLLAMLPIDIKQVLIVEIRLTIRLIFPIIFEHLANI